MGGDYPDWTRLFCLTGVAINIPINIVASDVILPVSLEAATATIDVNLVASDVTMPVSIDAATITLDVNLTAAEVTIDINFTDQSVAVFDSAKWFAHNAQQVFLYGNGSCTSGGAATVISYTVPVGKTFFGAFHAGATPGSGQYHGSSILYLAGSIIMIVTGEGGAHAILDVPFRATAGQVVRLDVGQNSTGTLTVYGCIGGWLE